MSLTVEIRHSFPTFVIDARFEAQAGVTVLFGRSGSGKTTIANAVAGLLRPEWGRISVADHVVLDTDRRIDLPPHKRHAGYIFQDSRLFPHLSVRQNLDYAARMTRCAPVENRGRIIDMLGIEHLLERRPAALSGGEKQRVAIGRALLSNPSILIADEPLAALDEARKSEILPYFERLRDEVSVPILYVTHSVAEVSRLATTVVALEHGRILRQGDVRDVLGDPDVAPTGVRDVGAVIEATVRVRHPDGLTELNAGGQPLLLAGVTQTLGTRIRVRIAAQDVILSRTRPEGLSALNIIAGTVDRIRQGDGPGAIVSLETPAGKVLARVTKRSLHTLGLEVGVEAYAIVKTVSIARESVGS